MIGRDVRVQLLLGEEFLAIVAHEALQAGGMLGGRVGHGRSGLLNHLIDDVKLARRRLQFDVHVQLAHSAGRGRGHGAGDGDQAKVFVRLTLLIHGRGDDLRQLRLVQDVELGVGLGLDRVGVGLWMCGEIFLEILVDKLVHRAVVPGPVGLVLCLIGTTINWTGKRWTFTLEIGK